MTATPRTVSTFLVAACAFAAASTAPAGELPVVRVGIITDGPVMRAESFTELFREELEDMAAGSTVIEFPDDAVVDGGWDPDRIDTVVHDLLTRNDIDLVLAAGVAASAEICGLATTDIPVIVPFAFGDCAVRCPLLPEIRTRRYDLGALVSRDLTSFHELIPFDRLAVLMDPSWPASCSGDELARALSPAGVEVELVPVPLDTADVMAVLPPGTNGVYILSLFQMDEARFGDLVRRLTSEGIPTFSLIGETEVDLGVLAGLNTRAAMSAFARGSALDAMDIIEGRNPEQMFEADVGGRLTLNMATAQALGFSPSWELMTRARLVHDEALHRNRPIDLASAINRAIGANLDLAVEDRRVAAGAEDIREARSNYRPRIDLGLAGAQIDENHAIAALGQYSRYAAGSVTLNQLIWSDRASADVAIQKELQRVRELDREALKLDIARDTVSAYLDVLRTEALVRIRRQQVDLTRTHRELARIRRTVGAAGAAEVYRWEAELATARAGLLEAISASSLTERQLSRLLDEPLTTRWNPKETEIRTTLEVLGGVSDAALLDTPLGYDRLSSSLVEEALANAPELAALDAVIAAQDRGLTAAKRASWAPDIGLRADLNQILAKDTSGGADLGEIADLIPEFDDTSWQVAVQAGLPIVTGGANKARRIRAHEELFALRTDRRNAEEKLSQRSLSALDTAIASWSTISLRRQAADAASQTLELVRDAYRRGAASIIDLLDAQNNALSSELGAVTAVYDFLDDWAEVQRSVARLAPGEQAAE